MLNCTINYIYLYFVINIMVCKEIRTTTLKQICYEILLSTDIKIIVDNNITILYHGKYKIKS